jgi:hypothetical protein
VTNAGPRGAVETSDEWIRTRTGIRERRVADAGDRRRGHGAAAAARQALERAGIDRRRGGPDPRLHRHARPSAPLHRVRRPGAARRVATPAPTTSRPPAPASSTASRWPRATSRRPGGNGAVICTEKMSSIVDWTDRTTCVLFGDGAGAAVVPAAVRRRGILSTFMSAPTARSPSCSTARPAARGSRWMSRCSTSARTSSRWRGRRSSRPRSARCATRRSRRCGARGSPARRSTCSCRTRPTSASSSRPHATPGCRWTRSSSTSTATAT